MRLMQKSTSLSSILILLSTLFAFHAVRDTSCVGTRAEDLVINFYGDIEDAYRALKNGSIDIVGYELTRCLYEDAITDANVVLASVSDYGMYQFDINSNCTIESYPGIRSPTNYRGFRQALAWLVDKNYIVNTILEGFGERIDQPLAAPLKGWRNESRWSPNYPYEYDPQAASAALDASGFVQGATPNPYYDEAFPGSAKYIRTYPSGHSHAGQDLHPLEVVVRTDDLRRLRAGRHLYENMRKHGIPVNPWEAISSWTYWKVMEARDYHIYTGAWSVGGFPPVTLRSLYCIDYWYPGGDNYVTGYDCSGLPNYQQLCRYLDLAVNAQTREEVGKYTRLALGYFTDECITIPLWSTRAFWAYSHRLLGVVNEEGRGPENEFTFINAYKADESAIGFGMRSPPNAMNIIYSDWYYDYQCHNRMHLYSFFDMPPYDLSAEQAGFVRDWDVSCWFDPNDGMYKTKVTRWFRDTGYFAEPVTGARKAKVNASHYFFTAWYLYQTSDAWDTQSFLDVHHIDVVDEYQVDIYFDVSSFWSSYDAMYYMLPVDVFLQPPLAYHATETFVEGTNLTTPGAVGVAGKPIWINSVGLTNGTLEMFSEYNVVKGELRIFVDVPENGSVTVDYWYVGDAHGYTAGDLSWEVMFEGAGLYYATDFVPGIGGHLTLKRNPYYWMATPLLGEVDFVWMWENGGKPRNGSYRIDIFDIVKAAGAYGSQGTGVPDSDWLPGADLAPPGGVIDIYDIVTIVSRYGQEWGP